MNLIYFYIYLIVYKGDGKFDWKLKCYKYIYCKKKILLYQEYYVGIINKMSFQIFLFVNYFIIEVKVCLIELNVIRQLKVRDFFLYGMV